MPEKSSVKKTSRIALISAALLLLTGCAELPADAPISQVDYKACVVEEKVSNPSPLADIVDYGVKQAVVTYGIGRSVVATSKDKFEATITKQVKQKCNLVVISGDSFADQISELAKANAAVNFVFVSDTNQSGLVYANLENLVVYTVDTYEAGLLAGYLAAGLTDNLRVLSELPFAEEFRVGTRDGVSKYSLNSGDSIENILLFDMIGPNGPTQPDVLLGGGHGLDDALRMLTDTEFKLVGYGRDFYSEPSFSKFKNRLAATIEPKIGDKLLDLIGSDLEGDFIGGTFGSYHATFGNGGLAVSPEHDINLPPALIEQLKTVALDYEASLKK